MDGPSTASVPVSQTLQSTTDPKTRRTIPKSLLKTLVPDKLDVTTFTVDQYRSWKRGFEQFLKMLGLFSLNGMTS